MDLEIITKTLGYSYSERIAGSVKYNLIILQPFYKSPLDSIILLWKY